MSALVRAGPGESSTLAREWPARMNLKHRLLSLAQQATLSCPARASARDLDGSPESPSAVPLQPLAGPFHWPTSTRASVFAWTLEPSSSIAIGQLDGKPGVCSVGQDQPLSDVQGCSAGMASSRPRVLRIRHEESQIPQRTGRGDMHRAQPATRVLVPVRGRNNRRHRVWLRRDAEVPRTVTLSVQSTPWFHQPSDQKGAHGRSLQTTSGFHRLHPRAHPIWPFPGLFRMDA